MPSQPSSTPTSPVASPSSATSAQVQPTTPKKKSFVVYTKAGKPKNGWLGSLIGLFSGGFSLLYIGYPLGLLYVALQYALAFGLKSITPSTIVWVISVAHYALMVRKNAERYNPKTT